MKKFWKWAVILMTAALTAEIFDINLQATVQYYYELDYTDCRRDVRIRICVLPGEDERGLGHCMVVVGSRFHNLSVIEHDSACKGGPEPADRDSIPCMDWHRGSRDSASRHHILQ